MSQAELLVSYDRKHGTQLVRTLRGFSAAGGDLRAAARELRIHPNTLRYRLKRIAEIAGLTSS